MTSLALLFTIASIGISEAVYLVRKRIAADAPICPIGGDCEIVLTSKYNKIFLIHNDILGLLAYITIAVLAAFLVIGIGPLNLWSLLMKILIGGAAIMSLVFTYLQWKVIRAWCFWCLMSACTIWLMGLILLLSEGI